VVRYCVWYRKLENEEALAHLRLSNQKQTNKATKIIVLYVIKIILHCREVNTSLVQKEKEKEMDPRNQCRSAKLW